MSSPLLYVDEIFYSMQGEGLDSGLPCIFIRLFGCSVGCRYCDQPQKKKRMMTVEDILNYIKRFKPCKYVCLTGGEPLEQWASAKFLVQNLFCRDYKVSIETSGCVELDKNTERYFKYVMDIKCPSSGVVNKNVVENIRYLTEDDEIKFVIANDEDYNYFQSIYNIIRKSTKATILVSPCFDKDLKPLISVEDLVNKMLADHITKVRISLQVHKFVGVK